MRLYRHLHLAAFVLVLADAPAQEQAPGFFYPRVNSYLINSDRAANPAYSVSRISSTSRRLGLEFRNNYLLQDVNAVSAYGSLPVKFITLGLEASYLGNEYVNVTSQTILLAKKLEKKLSLGIGVSHVWLNQAAGYPDRHVFVPSVGASIDATRKFTVSSCLKNIAFDENYVQQHLAIGISYKMGKCVFHGQYRDVLDGEQAVDFAGEYSPGKVATLFIRTSTGNEPFGLGCDLKLWGVNLSCELDYHEHLGASTQFDAYKQW